MQNIDHGVCYENFLREILSRPGRVLEIGAGTDELTPSRKNRKSEIWGIDPDPRVRNNHNIDHPIQGRVEEQTFQDQFFDAACARFVFEHIPNPLATLNTLYPWLKPGAKLLILTVNQWHYYVWMGRLIPDSLAHKIVSRNQRDIFPTSYNFNNPFKIKRQVAASLFGPDAMVRIILCENQLHFAYSSLRIAAGIYSKIVNATDHLRWLRVGLIIEITKPNTTILSDAAP